MVFMWKIFHQFGSPKYFYNFSKRLIPFLYPITASFLIYGLLGGLWLAPADYQQGDGFRIIYVHVPCAFLSMGIYAYMAAAASCAFIWKIKIADYMVKSCATLGAWFTFLALVTGSIWGKPMWGAWWVWDARLTSELILLFLYMGIISLQNAIPNKQTASKAVGILVLVGMVNLPIIHYSVYWWNTLHQGSTVRLVGSSLIASSMLYPLWSMLAGFSLLFFILLLRKTQLEILTHDKNSSWIADGIKHGRG
jgi:heme exporter protein C